MIKSTILACGSNGNSESIINIMKSMHIPHDPSTKFWNMLLNSYASVGNISKCLEMLDGMEVKLAEKSIAVNQGTILFAYNIAMKACQVMHNFEQALLIWARLKERQIAPDVITCSTLVNN